MPRNKTAQRIEFLQTALRELYQSKEKHKDIEAQIAQYQAEYHALTSGRNISSLATGENHEQADYNKQPKQVPERIVKISNWYKENNILLLLYLGALLMVLSAATFVGFNWEEISGFVKVAVLGTVTSVFLGSGLVIYTKSEKLRIAGTTFSTIGALLIPFIGIAVYNFIYTDIQYFGIIWTVTSAISLGVYLTFLRMFNKDFYKYIAVIATLSFVQSFARTLELENNFYMLGAGITSFILLAYAQLFQEKPEENKLEVFKAAAQIILPIFLILGSLVTRAQGDYYTTMVQIALLVAAIFYAAIYRVHKYEYGIYVTPLLAALLTGNFAHSTWEVYRVSFYCIFFVAIYMTIAGYVFLRSGEKKLAKQLVEGIGLAMIPTYLVASILMRINHAPGIDSIDLIVFSGIITTIGLYGYFANKSLISLTIGQMGLFISARTFFFDINPDNHALGLFSVFILAVSIINYLIPLKYSNLDEATKKVFETISNFAAFLSIVVVLPEAWFLIFVYTIFAIFFFFRSNKEQNVFLSYIPPLLLSLALQSLLIETKTPNNLKPLFYAMASTSLVIPMVLIKSEKYRVQLINFVNVMLVSSWYFVFRQIQGGHVSQYRIEYKLPILGAYLYSTLSTVVALMRNNRALKYVASVSWLLTYFWQLNLLGTRESLWYTIPLGIYLLVVGFIERQPERENYNIFEWFGLSVLFFGIWGKTDNINGFWYALIMAIEGVAILNYGITLANKKMAYTGIAFIILAILSQTYEYLTSLPRWILLSISGLLVLALAVYLLSKRAQRLEEMKKNQLPQDNS